MKNRNLLITGGAGFIGSHVVEYFAEKYPDYNIIVMDSLTYASNVDFYRNLKSRFPKVVPLNNDIRDVNLCKSVFISFKIDSVIHLAAESHVDNSISNPNVFAETNIIGTMNLLNAANNYWEDKKDKMFYHISTDEVYGALGDKNYFYENTPYDPKSPYSASKASSDHMVRAYGNTFKIPYLISNCSNNYGKRQHKEKLIPKTILNILNDKKVPVYGDGSNIRDWIHVMDHVRAIDTVFHNGMVGETYNIGSDYEISNLNLVKKIIEKLNSLFYEPRYHEMKIIEFIEDRKGHDFRYAINHNKLTSQLGWKPEVKFDDGLLDTIKYYINEE